MNKPTLFTLSNIFCALLFTILLITGAIILGLHFRPLYYFDVDFLNIPQISGLSKADVLLNYNALIDYNSVFMRGALNFPTLPMSSSGRIHFEEVKNIFVGVEILFGTSLLASIFAAFFKLRRKNSAVFKLAAVFSVGIPALLGLLIALNWEAFFIGFHKLFFRNDYWMFSAETDPIITILPDAFFMHCALLILALVVLGSLLLFFLNKILHKKFAV